MYRLKNGGREVQKHLIPNCINEMGLNCSETIKSGFRACGLYPFNEDNLDYSKLVTHDYNKAATGESNTLKELQEDNENIMDRYLHYLESKIDSFILEEFQIARSGGDRRWFGDIQYTALYDVWSQVKAETEQEVDAPEANNSNSCEEDRLNNDSGTVNFEDLNTSEIQLLSLNNNGTDLFVSKENSPGKLLREAE